MKLLIVVHHHLDLWNTPSWFLERLRDEFPQVEVAHLPNYDGIEAELPDTEVLVAFSVRPEQFVLAQKLRWIHSPAAAVHQFMFPEMVTSDVTLTNAREVHGPVVAEHTMALVFALAKKLHEASRFQQKHIWGQEPMWLGHPRPREVAGATIGLVGLGSIGRHVAKLASALDMHVIATREDPSKEKAEGVSDVFLSTQIDTLLEQSDYVVLSAPLTSSTRGLINAERIARMKPGACLINVGRGPLVDETALIAALREKRIGGAALDVFDEEPLPPGSPLWDMENVLITPHTAGITEKLWARHYALFSENLHRYLSHNPLIAIVDKNKGY